MQQKGGKSSDYLRYKTPEMRHGNRRDAFEHKRTKQKTINLNNFIHKMFHNTPIWYPMEKQQTTSSQQLQLYFPHVPTDLLDTPLLKPLQQRCVTVPPWMPGVAPLSFRPPHRRGLAGTETMSAPWRRAAPRQPPANIRQTA